MTKAFAEGMEQAMPRLKAAAEKEMAAMNRDARQLYRNFMGVARGARKVSAAE